MTSPVAVSSPTVSSHNFARRCEPGSILHILSVGWLPAAPDGRGVPLHRLELNLGTSFLLLH